MTYNVFGGTLNLADQWLKCNGMQGNAVPLPPILAQSVPPPQIVIMLGKGIQPVSGALSLM